MENSLIDKIEKIAIEILKLKSAVSVESAVILPEIVAEFQSRSANVKETTLSAYLSKLTRTESSPIRSAGKKRGFYYFEKPAISEVKLPDSPLLTVVHGAETTNTSTFPTGPSAHGLEMGSTPANNSSSDSSTQDMEAGSAPSLQATPRLQLEKKLYQIARAWLEAEGFNSEITGERTGNGKWGNPDITGIRVYNTASESKEVEIATVEVKISQDNWRQFIFEAVSHTRFSNLTYFCFAYPESDRNSFDSEFYMYAEEFGIGLLGIEMESTDFENFITNQYEPKNGDIEVVELNTPRFRSLRPYFREKFLKTLGIGSLTDLIRWPNLNSFKDTGS